MLLTWKVPLATHVVRLCRKSESSGQNVPKWWLRAWPRVWRRRALASSLGRPGPVARGEARQRAQRAAAGRLAIVNGQVWRWATQIGMRVAFGLTLWTIWIA